MPLPLLILGGLAAATTAYFALRDERVDKKFAILGVRGAGKTQFNHYLSTGNVNPYSSQTLTANKMKERDFTHKREDGETVKFIFNGSFDVAGDESAYDDWKRIVDKADTIIYLLPLNGFFLELDKEESPFINRVEQDIKYLANVSKKQQIYIIGTFLDQIKHIDSATAFNIFRSPSRKKSPSGNSLESALTILKSKVGSNNVRHIWGSLQSNSSAELLLTELLKQMTFK